jgi:deoxyribose-phosphate aldolase
MEINKHIEFTNLNMRATSKEITKMVNLAAERGYRAVVLTHNNVGLAKRHISKRGYDLKAVTVMGFPSDNYSDRIVHEDYTSEYDELDIVMPIQDYYYNYPPYLDRIESFLNYIKGKLEGEILGSDGKKTHKPIKLIVETALMRAKDMQIKELCELAKKCDINVIKTNTGLIKREKFQDLLEDVQIIKKYWRGDIKASGGIKTKESAAALIAVGATLIGTSNDLCAPEEKQGPVIIPTVMPAEEKKDEENQVNKDTNKADK